MAIPQSLSHPHITDPELAHWVEQGSEEKRELIVAAEVPRRRVRVEAGRENRPKITGFERAASPSRLGILQQLGAELASVTGEEPTLLRSAGALALRATGRQVRQFVDHPLIRSIRPNRRLAVR